MFVAQFIGQINFFEGKVREKKEDDLAVVENPWGTFLCPLSSQIHTGMEVTVAIRPEFLDVSKTLEGDDRLNVMEGKVVRSDFIGDALFCQILWGEKIIHVKLPSTMDIMTGDTVFIKVNSQYCHVFPEALR
jgi:ABC-type Fe3+/spermidine/putrescine transport system ATPase subunit